MGGPPSKATPKDKRLARNKPASKTPATVKSTAPYLPKKSK